MYKFGFNTNSSVLRNKHILLIDDEIPVLIMVKMLLERHGYQVTFKRCSTEAYKLFITQPEKFDLVITDFNMPYLTGDVIAKKFKAIRPDIPIILATGNSGIISQEKKAGKTKFNGFLKKPFTVIELNTIIHKVLNT